MAVSTRHRLVVKEPARAESIEANAAGSGHCSRIVTASRSAGSRRARTATTACCSPPTLETVAHRGLLADCETLHLDRGYDNGVVRRAVAGVGLEDLVCSKVRRPGRPRPPRRSCRSGCAGRSNAPTAGSRTSDSYAATPTGAPCIASRSSLSPSRCCSPPNSSTGATDGTRNRTYPLNLLAAARIGAM